jgi:hypothetical protein
MSNLTELGHKRDTVRAEIVRLSKHDARIHGISEDERAGRLLELNDELRLLELEIQHQAETEQARHVAQVYNHPVTREATKGDLAELKQAREALEKMVENFTTQTRGYAVKIHRAQVELFEAEARAGQPDRRSYVTRNALAIKLAAIVEHAVRHGG